MTAAAETTPPLFEVGRLIATAGVAEILSQMCESQYALLPALSRHVNGDWGNVSPQDKETNDAAVTNGSRIISEYDFGSVKIWIYTEGDRNCTTFLLPDEY